MEWWAGSQQLIGKVQTEAEYPQHQRRELDCRGSRGRSASDSYAVDPGHGLGPGRCLATAGLTTLSGLFHVSASVHGEAA